MEFLFDCIWLFDAVIDALFEVPVFAVFLGGFVFFTAFSVFLYLKRATGKAR